MTHLSPTTLLFCCTCTAVGFLYFLWHSWSFDKFQSLVPTRRRAFKTGLTWSVLIAYGMFGIWSIGMAYIKYAVGFTNVPGVGSVPTPYELWPENYKKVTDPLYYVLIVAWSMVLAIHIEETCFWIHLARSIRGQTTKTWYASIWFKLWVIGSIAGTVTLFLVAIPFHEDPQQIETNVFFAGICFTILFTAAGFYVILRFPILIETVRKQGGSQVVLMRLAYFRRLTKYRMVARIIFVVPFLVVSVDGLTPHHDVAEKQFLTDLFIMLGVVGLFASTVFSIYMFFPPSDPSVAHFATGDSRGLLPSRAGPNMSIDAMRSYFEPTGPRMPQVRSTAPHAVSTMATMSEDQYGQEERDDQKDHVRTQMSIIAPFADPPGVEYESDVVRLGDGYGSDHGHSSTGHGHGLERGRSKRTRKPSFPTLKATHPSRTNRPSQTSSEAESALASSSAYAWNLLADHLRLPSDAMGLMAEVTEMNGRAWRAATRTAEQELYPGQGYHHSEMRSTSPEKNMPMRSSGQMNERVLEQDHLQLNNENIVPRSLPPPLRSPPKAHSRGGDRGTGTEYPLSYSNIDDSQNLLTDIVKTKGQM